MLPLLLIITLFITQNSFSMQRELDRYDYLFTKDFLVYAFKEWKETNSDLRAKRATYSPLERSGLISSEQWKRLRIRNDDEHTNARVRAERTVRTILNNNHISLGHPVNVETWTPEQFTQELSVNDRNQFNRFPQLPIHNNEIIEN